MLKIKQAISEYNIKNPDKNMTQVYLASVLLPGIKPQSAIQNMSNWATGRNQPTLCIMFKICRECGVDMNFLTGYEK